MRPRLASVLGAVACFAGLILLHLPLVRLPYFWDEAGYYIPAALDFYRAGLLIPASTQPIGHTPLVMIYLGLVWRIFGYSTGSTRAAMTLVAAATVAALYAVGRRVANREIAVWSALLLALSPLFFAQSTLAHLDLAAALFTILAVLCLVRDQLWRFALAASLAVLSKETAVVLLPVAWLYAWRKRNKSERLSPVNWAALLAPLVPLASWALYYHHATGYWTGNRDYLSYNLYSTLSPARIFFSLLRRGYEFFIGGFNWLLTVGAIVGLWRGGGRGIRDSGLGTRDSGPTTRVVGETLNSYPESLIPNHESRVPSPVSRTPYPVSRDFLFLATGLAATYLFLLSVVGGAILPRYLLPVMPLFYLVAVALVMRLPRFPARLILGVATVCFVWGWFINPPYPFPLEDNLAYADFIRLHQQAAHYLEAQPGHPRILTAWPATDELTKPDLGYVRRPLRVAPVQGFSPQEFASVAPASFDLLYLYSRRWEPPGNWVVRFPGWLRLQGRYFDYQPQIAPESLVARFHLRLLTEMDRRGQWVRIYSH